MSTSKPVAHPRYHVISIKKISGVTSLSTPFLYIQIDDQPHLVESLQQYFLAYPSRSMSWKRLAARSLGLFYDFCFSVYESGEDISSSNELVRRFGISLSNGTFDHKNSEDRYKLFWPPSGSKQAQKMLSALMDFSEWCYVEGIISGDPIAKRNAVREEHNSIKHIYRAKIIKSKMFLGHSVRTSDTASNIRKRDLEQLVDFGIKGETFGIEGKIFPKEVVADLLKYGFVIDENNPNPYFREDITAKYITLLLLFGGLRVSEPFHLWFNDVVPSFDDNSEIHIYLRHPEHAETYFSHDSSSRKKYLSSIGLPARNDPSITGSYHSGWKNLATDSNQSASVFLLHRSVGALIKNIHFGYLTYRENLIRIAVERGETNHPFLFVSKGKGFEGNPYSMKSYKKALQRAYKRLNNSYGHNIIWGEKYGTTPHGMRHYYGQALTDCGMNQKEIQKCLHHRSIISQGVYTEPQFERIQASLNEAKEKIENGLSDVIGHADILAIEEMMND